MTDTSLSPDARRVWRAARTPVVIVVALLAAGIVLVLTRAGGSGGELDPESADPSGGRALARLLEGQGVDVRPVHRGADAIAAGATVLVTLPSLVDPGALRSLTGSAAEVVLVAPDAAALRALPADVTVAGSLDEASREPGCPLPAARAAGTVTIGGVAYRGGQSCYDGALVRDGDVTVLGEPGPLTNERLDDDGNAAMAMRVLGQHERLVWYVPEPADPARRAGDESLYDLLPPGWIFGAAQAGVAVVLLALWRVRRLGPVTTEPLPVVVRGAETVEGRARLYRAGGSAGHAADALRRACRQRLLPVLGLGADAGMDAVVNAIANRTGIHARELLYGPPPASDDQLVTLADELDELEREVGR